jgi:hypothetical protein
MGYKQLCYIMSWDINLYKNDDLSKNRYDEPTMNPVLFHVGYFFPLGFYNHPFILTPYISCNAHGKHHYGLAFLYCQNKVCVAHILLQLNCAGEKKDE